MSDHEDSFGFLLKETSADAPTYDLGTMDNQLPEHAYALASSSVSEAAMPAPPPPRRSSASQPVYNEAGDAAGSDYLMPAKPASDPTYEGLYALPGGHAVGARIVMGTPNPLLSGAGTRATPTVGNGIPVQQRGYSRMFKGARTQ